MRSERLRVVGINQAILSQLLRPFARGHGGILCFHGIKVPPWDAPTPLHVTFAHFREVLEAVESVARIVSVRELFRRFQAGESITGLAAITLDDAYASVLDDALPFVAAKEIPITVFVVSGCIQAGDRFWWDRLDSLASVLDMAGRQELLRHGPVGDAASGAEESASGLFDLRNDIVEYWKGRIPTRFEDVLIRMEDETGARTDQRAMTTEEIDRLLTVPSVDLGVHTVTHPVLPLLGDREVVDEIGDCYQALKARWDRVIPVLAVPFGLYDARTEKLAREAEMSGVLSLSGRTLRHPGPNGILSRFTVSQALPRWKLLLKLAGLQEALRRDDGGQDIYPPIP